MRMENILFIFSLGIFDRITFSVNGSGRFLGLARMNSEVEYKANFNYWTQNEKWKGFFFLNWIFIKDIPNRVFRNLINEFNENKPVTASRDTQEIHPVPGQEMLKIFEKFQIESSILDDFTFYEKKQDENQNSNFNNNNYNHQFKQANLGQNNYSYNNMSNYKQNQTFNNPNSNYYQNQNNYQSQNNSNYKILHNQNQSYYKSIQQDKIGTNLNQFKPQINEASYNNNNNTTNYNSNTKNDENNNNELIKTTNYNQYSEQQQKAYYFDIIKKIKNQNEDTN